MNAPGLIHCEAGEKLVAFEGKAARGSWAAPRRHGRTIARRGGGSASWPRADRVEAREFVGEEVKGLDTVRRALKKAQDLAAEPWDQRVEVAECGIARLERERNQFLVDNSPELSAALAAEATQSVANFGTLLEDVLAEHERLRQIYVQFVNLIEPIGEIGSHELPDIEARLRPFLRDLQMLQERRVPVPVRLPADKQAAA